MFEYGACVELVVLDSIAPSKIVLCRFDSGGI